MATLTKAQERSIEILKRAFLGFYGYPENKEIKEETIEEIGNGNVYVMLQVGYIGDEGTGKEIFCRHQLSVCVGKQGGYYNYSDSKSHYRKTYNNAILVCCKAQW